MKKQIVIFVVGIAVFVVGCVAHSFSVAANDCQKPSGNTEACYGEANDDIGNCEKLGKSQCELSHNYAVYHIYEIEMFPKGPTESDSGFTTEERVNCWRKSRCKWDDEEQKCVPTGNWSPWSTGWKTIVDPEGVCPQS